MALALGADAVSLARPMLWALAVWGRQGVEAYLSHLRIEFARTLTLLGVAATSDLNGAHVVAADGR